MFHKEGNSVLFSLSHLRTLAIAPGTAVGFPRVPGDATRIFDIRRLTSDLSLDGTSAVSPGLLMGPSRAILLHKWIVPLCIGMGTLIICIAILSLAMVYQQPKVKKVYVASPSTPAQPSPASPSRPLPVVVAQPLKAALQTPLPTKSKAEKPLPRVNNLRGETRTLPLSKARKKASKQKERAYRNLKRKRIALLKHRSAQQRRAKAVKQRRSRVARSVHAKKSRRDHVALATSRRGRSKPSEFDELLTGL